MYSSLWIRMWLPWSTSTQHGHVQPFGGRGAGGDDCWVQLWQVSHQPDHLTCKDFTIFVLQGFWATWTSATGVRDKRHLVTPGNPVLRWGDIFSICFTFSVFCLIDNPGSRYTWWTCTRSQVERSHDFQSYVDIIFGTLFYPQSLGNTKNSTCFICFDLAIDNSDYLVQI